ncbi:MAG: hypothetical protein PWQ79_2307 [Thermococcaceae archaeon]|nr:hypothetical protein [Thermococcaceae archaeon]MDK2915392.1 hypothetical protein [Thermococcaceae archaeon]
MELRHIVSAALELSGGFLALWGFLNANQSYVNLGIAGMFMGALVILLKSSEYVKISAVETFLKSQREFFSNLLRNLKLEGNAVYIPPYRNLPSGGIFVPLHEDFDLELARLDEEAVFLTDVPDERSMGLLITSLGRPLLEKYEEHLEGPITSIPELESASGSVLRALGLAKRVYIEEDGETLRVIVQPAFSCAPEECEKLPCPLCASILLGAAKASSQVIGVEGFSKTEHGVEIRAKKLGGVERWM